MEAQANASMALLVRPIRVDLARTPVLCWRWRVDAPIKTADLLRKSGDDYAARVYVAFQLPPEALGWTTRSQLALARSLFGGEVPDAAINYVWDNRHPAGYTAPNAYTATTRMVVVESGAARARRWVTARRNVLADAALASDVRFASEDARFNVAMARIGMTGCDLGISYFLPRSVGTSNAAEMMMGGRFVNAQKALRIGLVSDIAPRDQLEALGLAMADDMLRMSPLGLRLTKDGLNATQDAPSLDAAIALEDRQQVLCIGPYLSEGAAAFLQKRPAKYPET